MVLVLLVLFFERKTATSAWAWILILFFIPVLGFVLYLLFGKTLRPGRLNSPAAYDNQGFRDTVAEQLYEMKSGNFKAPSPVVESMMDIIQMNSAVADAPLSTASDIRI